MSERVVGRGDSPKRGFPLVAVMTVEGLSIDVAYQMLEVTDSRFLAWRKRGTSKRLSKHVW